MRRLTPSVKIVLLTLILALVSIFILFSIKKSAYWLSINNTSEINSREKNQDIPELSFCQLASKPEDYNGKVIRLSGVYMFGLHGPLIGDRNCSSRETQTWVKLSPKMYEEIKRATEKVYGINTSGPINLTAIGKFENNNPNNSSDGWADRVPFRFELIEIVGADRPR